jgi:hypothetical protein
MDDDNLYTRDNLYQVTITAMLHRYFRVRPAPGTVAFMTQRRNALCDSALRLVSDVETFHRLAHRLSTATASLDTVFAPDVRPSTAVAITGVVDVSMEHLLLMMTFAPQFAQLPRCRNGTACIAARLYSVAANIVSIPNILARSVRDERTGARCGRPLHCYVDPRTLVMSPGYSSSTLCVLCILNAQLVDRDLPQTIVCSDPRLPCTHITHGPAGRAPVLSAATLVLRTVAGVQALEPAQGFQRA